MPARNLPPLHPPLGQGGTVGGLEGFVLPRVGALTPRALHAEQGLRPCRNAPDGHSKLSPYLTAPRRIISACARDMPG